MYVCTFHVFVMIVVMGLDFARLAAYMGFKIRMWVPAINDVLKRDK